MGWKPTIFRAIKDARRYRGLTQSTLARQVGCTQSALSMLEQGKLDAVALSTLESLAKVLEIPLDDYRERDTPEPLLSQPPAPTLYAPQRAFCPDPECPSNVPLKVGERVLLMPNLPTNATGRYCPYCGEMLERTCPTCGANVRPGACCTSCGAPYVIHLHTTDAETWAHQRLQTLQTLHTLLH